MLSFNLNKMTIDVQKIIKKSHEIAIKNDSPFVSAEHLFCALVQVENNFIISIFENLDINYADFSDFSEDLIDYEDESQQSKDIKEINQIYLSQDFTKVLENSLKISDALSEKFISVEHLLLAFFDSTGKIKELLSSFEINKSKVLNIVKNIKAGKIIPKKEKSFKTLYKYTRNLTKLAKDNKLDPVIGREVELKRVTQILSRRNKNNPILIGEAGVGKTAIVEAIALQIASNDSFESIKNKEVLSLDLGLLIAGTKYRGEFEERLKELLKEIESSNGQIILFIDEVHTIMGAGATEGSFDAANILKPALARGEIKVIGATTIKEYQQHIEKDPALTRRFQPVYVQEPSIEDSILILCGLRERYEIFHGINVTDESIEAAVNLSSRYLTDRFLPDKAIDLIDEASASLRISLQNKPEKLDKTDKKVLSLEIRKKALENEIKNKINLIFNKKKISEIEFEIQSLKNSVKSLELRWKNEIELNRKSKELKAIIDDFKSEEIKAESIADLEKAAEIKHIKIPEKESELKKVLLKIDKLKKSQRLINGEVRASDIASVIHKWTNIPVDKILENEASKLLNIEGHLKKNIVGQDLAIEKISACVRRSRTGISDPNKVIGSFIFLGSSGVGKTELAKKLAEFIFSSEESLIRIDMSELMEKHSISKLIGSPPGYVGFEEGGILSEKIRHRPYSVVLFDEIEKAHPESLNILLQILDNGFVTDSKGRKINFRNTIIIMTSNLGSNYNEFSSEIGFVSNQNKKQLQEKNNERIHQVLKDYFKPEFLNRIDEIIVFQTLDLSHLEKIIKIQINLIQNRLEKKNIGLSITPLAIKKIAEKNINNSYGARPIKRFIQDQILNNLALTLIKEGDNKFFDVLVDFKNENFDIKIKKKNLLSSRINVKKLKVLKKDTSNCVIV